MADERVRARTTDFLAGTGMPAELFYAWYRQGMPTDAASPWRTGIDRLRAALLGAVEQNISNQTGMPQHARELASLDPADWERVLAQAGSAPPDGMGRSEYARSLAMETAAAFPEAAFRHRATRVPLELTGRLQQIRVANVHPGLGLHEIFSREPDADKAAALAAERVGWLGVVFHLNPEVAFLSLNYLPGSVDLNAVNFGELSAEARHGVLSDLKAYQRIQAVTANTIPAMEIMRAGFHSASAIALAGESDFADRTGLPAAEARKYQDAAREGARAPAAAVLACPVCREALTIRAAAALCPNAHTFDRARSGYLNLLLSTKKQSAEPGDSPAMLQSRRAFLQGGFYDPMAAAVTTAVAGILAGRHDAHVADLGCGEGFFTARLKSALRAAPAPACYGVDISRPGIRMATSYDRAITWIVGSLHRSPFRPQSIDVVLSMFAPIDAADVRRVLRDDGALVTVTPGPDHLDMLRLIIYSSVRPHPQTPALMAGDTLFERTASTRVRHPIVLDSPAQIMNLLAMTPYYWHIHRAARTHLETLTRLELTVDAYVSVFRPSARIGAII